MYFDNLEKYKQTFESQNSFFSLLSSKEKNLLKLNTQCVVYTKGETIFKEGDKPTSLILLIDGKIKIFKEGYGGREQIVRLSKPIVL